MLHQALQAGDPVEAKEDIQKKQEESDSRDQYPQHLVTEEEA